MCMMVGAVIVRRIDGGVTGVTQQPSSSSQHLLGSSKHSGKLLCQAQPRAKKGQYGKAQAGPLVWAITPASQKTKHQALHAAGHR